jgi:hypothetical protein
MRDPNLTADIERANAAKARQFRAAAQRLYPGRADGLNEYEAAGLKLQAERREREQREREREAYFAAVASGERSLSGRQCSRVEAGWALAILEAVPSAVLSANAKRLWRRYVELDRPRSGKPGGCWAKRATLAGRLGMNAGSVKRLQGDLRALGLLVFAAVGNRTRAFPLLPVSSARPEGLKAGRETHEWIARQAAELAALLRERKRERAASRNPREDTRMPATKRTPREVRSVPDGGTDRTPAVGTNRTHHLTRSGPSGPRNGRAA